MCRLTGLLPRSIIEGAKDGKGRGRQVIAVARTCDLIFIVLDALQPLHHKQLIEVGLLSLPFILLLSFSKFFLLVNSTNLKGLVSASTKSRRPSTLSARTRAAST
jgi:hypothetical protein